MVLLIPDLMKSQLRTFQLFEFKLHFGDTKTVLCFDALLQLVSRMDLQFEWDEVEAFVRQPDGSLFNWCERFCCFTHLLYGITFILTVFCFSGRVFGWSVSLGATTCHSLGVCRRHRRHGLLRRPVFFFALPGILLCRHGLGLVFVFLAAEYTTPQNSLNQGYELLHQMESYINQPGLVSQESLLFCYGQLPYGVGDVSPPARLTMMWTLMWLCGTKFIFIEICRALAYVHGVIGVCHRDIKPQNLLVNPHTHQLKICDFGSAEKMVPGEPNISYICSRYYIAPELIFGAIEYTTTIDMWSVGCVLAELLLGQTNHPIDLFCCFHGSLAENAHHRRSVAASLVQGVYVLERDRLENRQGPHALAS
ncbi:hypothetical protein IFM89_018481 [Coptis chinensis]|uniref:Protein kinase domain-containing protein n=1 Tax=Coptis chinensis TaxID=261450 RepID=A0A835MBU3_9MAGN|nr:hypothetical protein IFM89_018481 [Coptis chinensis]